MNYSCSVCGNVSAVTSQEVIEMSRIMGNNFDIITEAHVSKCDKCSDTFYTESVRRQYHDDSYKDGSASRYTL